MRFVVAVGAAALLASIGSPVVAGEPIAPEDPANGRIAIADDRSVGSLDDYRRVLEILSIDPVDGSSIRLTRGTQFSLAGLTHVSNVAPAWSSDGSQIAYASDSVGPRDLYIMDAFGGDPRRITTGLSDVVWTYGLDWSPDGSQLLATGLATGDDLILDGGDPPGEVWMVDIDTGGWRFVYRCSGYCRQARWSPDGTRIVVGDGPIAVMRPDGSGVESLASFGSSPSWSRDGSMILYVDHTDDLIHGIDPDTREDVVILDPATYGSFDGVTAPMESPDGERMAFIAVTYVREPSFRVRYEVWVVPLDDGGQPIVVPFTPSGYVGEFASFDWQVVPRVPAPVGLVNPDTGMWHLGREDGTTVSFYFGDPGDVPVMGDWDCDGVDTPGLFRRSDAFAYLRNANSQGIADVRFFFGNPDDVPLAGDWNGDGCDTLSLYRPSEQRFYVINHLGDNDGGLGAADYSFLFGNPGDTPVAGDWDGDGITEVGLHRPSTGLFYWRDTLDTGTATDEIYFGDPGDHFVTGDWNDDGVDTPAVFRPSDHTFYLRHSLTQGNADGQFTWGKVDWIPVAGTFGM